MFKGASIFAAGATFGILAGTACGVIAGFALGIKIEEASADEKTYNVFNKTKAAG